MRKMIFRVRPAPVLALGMAACVLWLGAPAGLQGAQEERPESGRATDTIFGPRSPADRPGGPLEGRIKELEKAIESIEARQTDIEHQTRRLIASRLLEIVSCRGEGLHRQAGCPQDPPKSLANCLVIINDAHQCALARNTR